MLWLFITPSVHHHISEIAWNLSGWILPLNKRDTKEALVKKHLKFGVEWGDFVYLFRKNRRDFFGPTCLPIKKKYIYNKMPKNDQNE